MKSLLNVTVSLLLYALVLLVRKHVGYQRSKPQPLALESKLLTTGPPGKPLTQEL